MQAANALPHSKETEEILVGGLLAREEWLEDIVDLLHSSDFYDPLCERIWKAMIRLYNANKRVDMVSVAQLLSPKKTDELIRSKLIPLTTKGIEFLASWNVREYAQRIRELSERRRLIRAGEEIVRLALEGEYGSNRELFDEAEKRLSEAEPVRTKTGGLVSITELIHPYMDALETLYKKPGTLSGTPTGFPSLDAYMCGLQEQDFIVIGARPAIGKTTFVLNIGYNVAQQENTYFALFSLEMDKDRGLMNRIVASKAQIDLQILRSGDLDDDQWKLIARTLSELPDRFLIDDTASMTVTYIKREVRRLRRRIGPEARLVVAIDYLQRIRRPRNMSRFDFVTEAAIEMKELARECNCTVIALSQLNRGVEQRQEKKPVLSDLRESGQIEQEADIVAFLHRDDYYDADAEKKGVMEIIFAKNRNAPTGTVELGFIKRYQKFFDPMTLKG
jgi:replicative DNA helicase